MTEIIRDRETTRGGDPLSAARPAVQSLLDWYDTYGRDLPWRLKGGASHHLPDPYRVWLSEVMLQQTGVETVKSYYEKFLARWTDIHALAASDLDEVLHAWQGLGYYARARNLHACARVVSHQMGGRFPQSEAELLKLPGIGPYSAAAIAAIAFDQPANVVDGNVERVVARLYAVRDPLPGGRRKLKELASRLAPQTRPGDYAQALMDLGATLCTPRKPDCPSCPWRGACRAHAGGEAEFFPVKKPKSARPVRKGVVFWAQRGDGAVLLQRRPQKGLLGGMMEFPSTIWRGEGWQDADAALHAPFKGEWASLPGEVRHTFTHFHLELTVLKARYGGRGKVGKDAASQWLPPEDFSRIALPTVMKKVAAHVERHCAGEGPEKKQEESLAGKP